MFIADAGPDAGLGHLSRSSALAVALRCRGFESNCYARGSDESFDRDGVRWNPAPADHQLEFDGRILVVDSYLLAAQKLEEMAESTQLVVMHDHGRVPAGAALVVSPASAPENGHLLGGLEYVPLRPEFWGLPTRSVRDHVRRVLVTTGSGKFDALGHEIAGGIASAMPEAEVTLVWGPHAGPLAAPEGVVVLAAPNSLVDALLSTDVVVTAGGQTMLEAVAAGTPCTAIPLVENQRPQVARLAGLQAVRVIDPPDPNDVARAVIEVSRDATARRDLSRRSQSAIDGYGALRVAFRIGQLVRQ